MKLIDKIQKAHSNKPTDYSRVYTPTAGIIEQISDDYAIEFSDFCAKYRDKNRNAYGDMLHAKSKYDESYTTKELLEIYKNEKGL
jgi:hypothetical protein